LHYAAATVEHTTWANPSDKAETDCFGRQRLEGIGASLGKSDTYSPTHACISRADNSQTKVLGVSTAYTDPHVEQWGLKNILCKHPPSLLSFSNCRIKYALVVIVLK
jgi:hypothetical protein